MRIEPDCCVAIEWNPQEEVNSPNGYSQVETDDYLSGIFIESMLMLGGWTRRVGKLWPKGIHIQPDIFCN